MKQQTKIEKTIVVGQDVYQLTVDTDTTVLNAVRSGGACSVSMPVSDGDVKKAIRELQERLGYK